MQSYGPAPSKGSVARLQMRGSVRDATGWMVKRRKENSEVLKGLYWNDVSPELSIVIIEVLASASRRVHGTTGQAKDALLYCALLKYHKIEFFIYFMH
jgi:hypothetical protein